MPDSIRILTWNIWWKFGPWRERQEPLLSTIEASSADIVCLQEVFPADEDGRGQAARFADRLGFESVTSFAPERPWLGNAILSRWPIADVEVQALPESPGRRALRSAIHTVVRSPHGDIPVTTTHLTWEYDESATRTAQIRAIIKAMSERRDRQGHAFPPLLCGDFNATPDSDEIRELTGRAAVARKGLVFVDSWPSVHDDPGPTWHRDNPHLAGATWPQRRLDYVFVGWPRDKPAGSVEACQIVGDQPVDGMVPSDHYGVVVDLLV